MFIKKANPSKYKPEKEFLSTLFKNITECFDNLHKIMNL